eukprot:363357-Chlamydomonas_euryale.AAC.4
MPHRHAAEDAHDAIGRCAGVNTSRHSSSDGCVVVVFSDWLLCAGAAWRGFLLMPMVMRAPFRDNTTPRRAAARQILNVFLGRGQLVFPLQSFPPMPTIEVPSTTGFCPDCMKSQHKAYNQSDFESGLQGSIEIASKFEVGFIWGQMSFLDCFESAPHTCGILESMDLYWGDDCSVGRLAFLQGGADIGFAFDV